MKIVSVISFRELVAAKLNPYQSVTQPWNYLLLSDDGRYGFSVHRHSPTAWTQPCADVKCSNGWHTAECIKAFKTKMQGN